MKNLHRHIDKGIFLHHFADEIFVRCVRCNTAGKVLASWKPYKWTAKFTCSCGCSLSTDNKDWVGPVCLSGQQRCNYCGHKWLSVCRRFEKKPPIIPKSIDQVCKQCNSVTPVKVDLHCSSPMGDAVDPHFGMPLQLIQPCKYGTIWAYNLRHLNELIDYTQAKLRTRQGVTNRSMFSRLPSWMKMAKNRELILKALDNLKSSLTH